MTPDSQLRWGILGAARIAHKIAAALQSIQAADGTQILAVLASREAGKGADFAESWGIPKIHTGPDAYDALLADPSVDAVYIPLPNHLHASWTIRALQAGKHVLCEKPLALSVDEVRRMSEASVQTGRVLAEAFMYRALERTRALRDCIARGELGEVRWMRGSFHFHLNRPVDVRWDPAMGGGALLDVGTYPISMARLLAGREPQRVRAFHKVGRTGVDVETSGLLDFGAFRAEFSCGYEAAFSADFAVAGSLASLHAHAPWFGEGAQTFSLIRNRETVESVTVQGAGAYAAQLRAFRAQILGGEPFMSLSDSLEQMRTLMAVRQSAEKDGAWVDLADVS